MATRTGTVNELARDEIVVTWSGLLNGPDSGDGQRYTRAGDRAVQVIGTFGAGGTIILEGSLDGSNWAQLHDPGGTLISFTTAGIKAVLEATPYVRPRITGGDGTTNLTCMISSRRK